MKSSIRLLYENKIQYIWRVTFVQSRVDRDKRTHKTTVEEDYNKLKYNRRNVKTNNTAKPSITNKRNVKMNNIMKKKITL